MQVRHAAFLLSDEEVQQAFTEAQREAEAVAQQPPLAEPPRVRARGHGRGLQQQHPKRIRHRAPAKVSVPRFAKLSDLFDRASKAIAATHGADRATEACAAFYAQAADTSRCRVRQRGTSSSGPVSLTTDDEVRGTDIICARDACALLVNIDCVKPEPPVKFTHYATLGEPLYQLVADVKVKMGSPPGHLLIAIAERYDYMQNTDVRAALVEQRSSRDWPNMGASLRDLQSLAEVAFRFFVSVTFRRPGWIEARLPCTRQFFTLTPSQCGVRPRPACAVLRH